MLLQSNFEIVTFNFMKLTFFILIISLTSITLAQTGAIESLYVNEKVNDIPNYFNTTIDLDIPNAKGTYDKGQAKIIFQNFLNKKTFVEYSKKHSGGGNGKSNFEIGNLKMISASYRTYILYNLNNQNVQIIELRIEKE